MYVEIAGRAVPPPLTSGHASPGLLAGIEKGKPHLPKCYSLDAAEQLAAGEFNGARLPAVITARERGRSWQARLAYLIRQSNTTVDPSVQVATT